MGNISDPVLRSKALRRGAGPAAPFVVAGVRAGAVQAAGLRNGGLAVTLRLLSDGYSRSESWAGSGA